jgi:hypothetical protein
MEKFASIGSGVAVFAACGTSLLACLHGRHNVWKDEPSLATAQVNGKAVTRCKG